ncbi:MAG TPA: site-2 protease family protein [Candidatus Limnocylindria bacterium]|jgi:Zn-dependent protease|nr:site-2 protease family protein [Candidatus Limnocylindria bacterium]
MIFGYGPDVLIGLVTALVVGTTFHEFSHAFVADQLGDHRPRAMGRVSLNPLHHLDPMGTIFFLIAGFGWGKPVMVNAYALRPGRRGMAWVAAAGPLANLVVATVFAVVFRGAEMSGVFDSQTGSFIGRVLLWVVEFNVILGLFNLLPIPPLDGYNLVLPFLPLRTALMVQRYAVYGVLVLLVLVLLPRLGGGFSPLDWLFGLAQDITRLLIGA